MVIVGGSGLLGSSIYSQLIRMLPNCETLRPSRSEFQLAGFDAATEFLDQSRPRLVINCGAFTDVDAAELMPLKALEVNALGVRNLALACRKIGAHLIHVSTDYVFSGSPGTLIDESASPNPSSSYGYSKWAGERWASDILGGQSSIVRTSWLYAKSGKSFVARFAKWAREGREVAVEGTCASLPTFTTDLATQIVELARRIVIEKNEGASGVFHFANSGPTTKFEVARYVYSLLDQDPDLVTAATWQEIPHLAKRPGWSCLADTRSESLGLSPLRPWKTAVRACLMDDTSTPLSL